MCSQINVTLWLHVFSPMDWCFLSSCGFVCFHLLCTEFLVESSVLVAWWSYTLSVSVYCGRFLLLCQFWVKYPRAEVIFIQCMKYLTPSASCLKFPLRNLLWFWWVYLYKLFVFSLLQPSIFFLYSLSLLFWWQYGVGGSILIKSVCWLCWVGFSWL
jgi:hypothetical protein